jgi:hypothetical protein
MALQIVAACDLQPDEILEKFLLNHLEPFIEPLAETLVDHLSRDSFLSLLVDGIQLPEGHK